MYNTINFNIYGQLLKQYNSLPVVANTSNYLKTKFNFSDDWGTTTKTAIFEHGNTGYQVILIDDECYVPWEVIKTPGFRLSVYGGNGNTVVRTTTLPIKVLPSGMENAQEPLVPTANIYDQIISILDTKQDIIVAGDGIAIADGNTISVASVYTEAETSGQFPAIGRAGKLYIDKINSTIYRWDTVQNEYVIAANDWHAIESIDSDAMYI